jgi:hypothetical protein
MKKMLFVLTLMIFSTNLIIAQNNAKGWNKEKEKLLESFAMLGSSNIYLSYLSLTFIERDIQRNEKTEEITTIIKSVQNLNETLKADLEKLKRDVILIDSDFRLMDSILEISDTLLKDAELLKVYAMSKKEQDRQKFFENHTLLYDKMNKLFYGNDKKNKENNNE